MIQLDYNSHIEPYINDGLFIIDSRTRTIQLYSSDASNPLLSDFYIGAHQDANIQHIIFRIDRIYESLDLNAATHAYIFFQPENEEPIRVTLDNNKQYYNDDYIYLDWTIVSEVTQYVGNVNFSICLQKKEEPSEHNNNIGTIFWEFNSNYTSAIIVPSLSASEESLPITTDTYETYDSWQGKKYSFSEEYEGTIWVSDDPDKHIIINTDSEGRTLTIPTYMDLGRETDHMMKVIYIDYPLNATDFQIDQTWELYANYSNAKGQRGTSKLKLCETGDDQYICGAWFIPIGATQYAGLVDVSFSAIKRNEDTSIQNRFNSAIGTLQVYDSLVGGEMLVILSEDEFENKLTDKLPNVLSQLLSKSQTVILNGDVW